MRSLMVSILVVAMILFAGCGSSIDGSEPTVTHTHTPSPSQNTTTESRTPTTQASGPVIVRTGSLPFNASLTYLRVTEMLNGEVGTVPVSVLNKSDTAVGSCYRPPIYAEFGVTCETTSEWAVTGQVGLDSTGVTLYITENATAAEIESTLAHEFVHVQQNRRGYGTETVKSGSTTDHRLVASAIIEGQAAYINRVYNDRYLDGYPTNAQQQYQGIRGYYRAGIYYFGARYIAQRVNSPEDSWEVFESPPTTTEQLIHGYAPSEEPPAAINTTVTVTGTWTEGSRDRLGELAIRNLLRTNLTEAEADTAATGWGNDEVIKVSDGDGTTGYVWVLKWDSSSDATEFRESFVSFANERFTQEGRRTWISDETEIRLKEVSDRTLLITLGVPQESITVNQDNENITIGET